MKKASAHHPYQRQRLENVITRFSIKPPPKTDDPHQLELYAAYRRRKEVELATVKQRLGGAP